MAASNSIRVCLAEGGLKNPAEYNLCVSSYVYCIMYYSNELAISLCTAVLLVDWVCI